MSDLLPEKKGCLLGGFSAGWNKLHDIASKIITKLVYSNKLFKKMNCKLIERDIKKNDEIVQLKQDALDWREQRSYYRDMAIKLKEVQVTKQDRIKELETELEDITEEHRDQQDILGDSLSEYIDKNKDQREEISELKEGYRYWLYRGKQLQAKLDSITIDRVVELMFNHKHKSKSNNIPFIEYAHVIVKGLKGE